MPFIATEANTAPDRFEKIEAQKIGGGAWT
jgi:hypothetical protein